MRRLHSEGLIEIIPNRGAYVSRWSEAEIAGLRLRIPRPRFCTDNGAMIAAFAAHLLAAGAPASPLDAPSDPGMPVVKSHVG